MRSLSASLAFVVFTYAATAQAPSTPAASNFQPVANMSQLMIEIIYPTSNAIFYVERKPPQTQSDWNDLKAAALTLAESGNLLMMPSRTRDQGEWIKDAKLLVEAGAAAYKAAQAKDLKAVLDLNDQLYTSCVTCHQNYRPNYRRRLPEKESK
jgi:hypothetical protein